MNSPFSFELSDYPQILLGVHVEVATSTSAVQFGPHASKTTTASSSSTLPTSALLLSPASTVPHFSTGSVVRVLPVTTPGVRPIHAEGILFAKVFSHSPNSDDYYVSAVGSKKRRRVSSTQLVTASTVSRFVRPLTCYINLTSLIR